MCVRVKYKVFSFSKDFMELFSFTARFIPIHVFIS